MGHLRDISIIGAGIGGLTTALTLQQRGFSAKIYESSAAIKPVGAGILIAGNAMRIFQKLGLNEQIEHAGNKICRMRIADSKLRRISVIDLQGYEKKYGVYTVAIHRGELQMILAGAVGPENIHLSKRLSIIEKTDTFRLTFEDNTSMESKYLIGADGIKSTVRNQLFKKSTIRYADQKCWRGICEMELPEKYGNELTQAWGKGKRFGFVKIGDKKVYWFALVNAKNTQATQENLSETFKEFHADILNIISATPAGQIITTGITDLKPIYTWQSENVCLIGDAAHASTPYLAQGACQAIEDADALGKLLDEGVPFEQIFKQYENRRRMKAHLIVNMSRCFGKIAHIENGIGIWLRNTAMRSLSSLLPSQP